MALFLHGDVGDRLWAVWKTEETADVLLSFLPVKQQEACRVGMERFTALSRKLEWLSVRVLLYTVLQEEKDIAYTPEGKPFLADHSYFISISHTRGYVALALSKSGPLGIDIEQYGKKVHRVAERFVRSDESVCPYQGDDTWSLLLHWSAKEAVYKRMEHPDADLCKLRLLPFVPQRQGTFCVQEEMTTLRRQFDVGYQIHSGFVLTWTLT